jgi:hypothetical protein
MTLDTKAGAHYSSGMNDDDRNRRLTEAEFEEFLQALRFLASTSASGLSRFSSKEWRKAMSSAIFTEVHAMAVAQRRAVADVRALAAGSDVANILATFEASLAGFQRLIALAEAMETGT